MKNPRISLLMPSFNAERYVASTLDTIIAQSFKDWEAVVMDGGSKDGTLTVLKRYQEKYPNIRVYSEPDDGLYHAIYKAAERARGEFVADMCFSDGFLDKNWLTEAVAAFDDDKEISLVWGIPFDMKEDGTLLGPNYIYARFLREDIRAVSQKTPVTGTLLKKFDLRHPSSVMRSVRKISPATVRSAFRMIRYEEVPQKQEWFLYWLKMGTIYPDLNMLMPREIFFECMLPHVPGSHTTGDWCAFTLNFNSRGYLAHCIPVAANYGRVHGDSATNLISARWNSDQHERYLRELSSFAKKVGRHPEEVIFIDREKKPLMSLAEFKK